MNVSLFQIIIKHVKPSGLLGGDKKVRDATKKEIVLREAVLLRKCYKTGSYSCRLGLNKSVSFLTFDWSVDSLLRLITCSPLPKF